MTNNKKNVRSRRRVANMAAELEPAFSPSRRGAKTEEWHVYRTADDRFTWREVRNGQRQLIDFSLSQWHWVGPDQDDWAEIARVDCEHGDVHRHAFPADGRAAIRRKYCEITDYADIERGRDYAENSILGRWDENLRRWDYGARG